MGRWRATADGLFRDPYTAAMSEKIVAVDVFPVSCLLPRAVGDGQGLQPKREETFVRVTASSGAYGWGEGGPVIPGAYLLKRVVGPAIIGLNPMDFDLVHDRMTRTRAPRGSIGAVDIAIWDLRGKLSGQPVASLLGGARRERVLAYASLHNYSESVDCSDEFAELVSDAKRRGFRSLKMKIGGRSPEEDLRYLELARQVGGDDFGLMADANQTYSVPLAVRIGRLLEELGFAWFEEPIARTNLPGYAELRSKLDIAIAGGEGATSAADIQLILAARCADIVQSDVAGVGGFSEARFIPRVAALWGASPTWHVWNSPLVQVATLHVLANQEAWHPQSMLPQMAPLEVTTMPSPMREHLLIGAPTIDADGTMKVPTSPGLGVDVDLAVLKAFALEGVA